MKWWYITAGSLKALKYLLKKNQILIISFIVIVLIKPKY